MKLQVNVTKEILEKSKYCRVDVSNCAVARALRTIFPNAQVWPTMMAPFGVEKFAFSKWMNQKPKDNFINMPECVDAFIREFDSDITADERASIEPISFEIEIPDEVINRIDIEQIEEVLKCHPTLQFV